MVVPGPLWEWLVAYSVRLFRIKRELHTHIKNPRAVGGGGEVVMKWW